MCKPDYYPLTKKAFHVTKSIISSISSMPVFDQCKSLNNIKSKLVEFMDEIKYVESCLKRDDDKKILRIFWDTQISGWIHSGVGACK